MSKREKPLDQMHQEYREESVKPALVVMLIAVTLISLALLWTIRKIGEEGQRSADISRYNDLASIVEANVSSVRTILANDVVDEKLLASVAAPVVSLITPDIAPTNFREAANQDPMKLNVKLNAIYWSTRDPLATIDGESYRTGEIVKGHKIVEIRKTEVVFLSPMGETIVKYFYEYLDKSKK